MEINNIREQIENAIELFADEYNYKENKYWAREAWSYFCYENDIDEDEQQYDDIFEEVYY